MPDESLPTLHFFKQRLTNTLDNKNGIVTGWRVGDFFVYTGLVRYKCYIEQLFSVVDCNMSCISYTYIHTIMYAKK